MISLVVRLSKRKYRKGNLLWNVVNSDFFESTFDISILASNDYGQELHQFSLNYGILDVLHILRSCFLPNDLSNILINHLLKHSSDRFVL